jgi:hypothetical protein
MLQWTLQPEKQRCMLAMWSVATINRLTDNQVIEKNMASAMEINAANEVKAAAAEFGFNKQMSLYGVLTDKVTGKSEYRRIEVIADADYNSQDIEFIHRFFREIKPAPTYTIWIYHQQTKQVALVGSFN